MEVLRRGARASSKSAVCRDEVLASNKGQAAIDFISNPSPLSRDWGIYWGRLMYLAGFAEEDF